jgi:hypothetical protein
MKIGCVIQGDIRRGVDFVLQELVPKFDYTVLSTWESERNKVPLGNFDVLYNSRPVNHGLTNRNLQRLSSARGINAARHEKCDYVLKWRTDMLPTRLDVDQLIHWANSNIPHGMKSRLVCPAFRNLSVEPDWFSSIPDLFSFGHIESMELLWGDVDFDYMQPINIPTLMLQELGSFQFEKSELERLYCPESELYAILRSRLEARSQLKLDHCKICKNFMRLFDHQVLNIYWFDRLSGFRSIYQAWEHPWWTESIWAYGNPKKVACGYPVDGIRSRLLERISRWLCRAEILRQDMTWKYVMQSRFF